MRKTSSSEQEGTPNQPKLNARSRVEIGWVVKEIKSIRLEQSITATQLSVKAGYPKDWWGRVEAGKRHPKMYQVEQVASALGYDIDLILR
jgi:hypothetical protein